MNALGLFLPRVQHLRCSHLHLQSCLHNPGVSVFDGIMYRKRQRKRLPPQTCWNVFRIRRWVQFPRKKVTASCVTTSCPTQLTNVSPFPRSLFLHLTGGNASVSQTHDRERGHNLDRILLRLVLCLRLHWLCPPLSHWHRPPDPLHAPDAQKSMGDLHGC